MEKPKIIKRFGYMKELHKRNFKNYFVPIMCPKTEPLRNNSIHWVGHATVVINVESKVIVTDPVTSFALGHLKRKVRPSLILSSLHIDYILLSHGHMDHFHTPTLSFLNKDAVVIAPPGYKKLILPLGFKKVIELSPGEEYADEYIEIKVYKANHDGRRYYLGNYIDSNSYLICRKGKSVFFAGDTAYTENFKAIKADIALMPVGCYRPEEFEKMHCTPLQSFKMFKMMDAKLMVPIHYKTFILSQEEDEDTVETLNAINDGTIKLLDIGETLDI